MVLELLGSEQALTGQQRKPGTFAVGVDRLDQPLQGTSAPPGILAPLSRKSAVLGETALVGVPAA